MSKKLKQLIMPSSKHLAQIISAEYRRQDSVNGVNNFLSTLNILILKKGITVQVRCGFVVTSIQSMLMSRNHFNLIGGYNDSIFSKQNYLYLDFNIKLVDIFSTHTFILKKKKVKTDLGHKLESGAETKIFT